MGEKEVKEKKSKKIEKDEEKTDKSLKTLVIILCSLLGFAIVSYLIAMAILGGFFNKTEHKKDSKTKVEEKENIKEEVKKPEKEEEKELERTGKEITIYYAVSKDSDTIYGYYTDKEDLTSKYYNFNKVASFKCESIECEYIDSGKDYVLVRENNGYSLYNYNNDKQITKDFAKDKNFKDYTSITEAPALLKDYTDNSVYGIVATAGGKTNLYNIKSNKVSTEIDGYRNQGPDSSDYAALFKNGLIYLRRDDYNSSFVYDFANDRMLIDNINVYNAVGNDEEVFIITGEYNGPKTIYNSKGSKVLEDLNINDVYYSDNKLIVEHDNMFSVYNLRLSKLKDSKKYTDILTAGKDYALVIEGTKLQLVDLNDNLLTTFVEDYNKDKYQVHTALSGWFTDHGKYGIYFVIEQDNVDINEVLKENPDMTKESIEYMDLGYEYYYIPTTKETGKIATYIGGYAKPVLYLYPKEKTNVTVSFKHNEWLTTTYPKFINSWNVVATKDGNLTDTNGRNYYALYWEELKNHDVDFKEGFYVESKDAIKFLEEKLEIIGLNERESNEFIMYWLPILENNKKNLIYFELTEERDSYNKLIINPKPDSILRMAMHVKKVDNKVNIKEQKLEAFNRTGFSAVEWGGVIH